MLTLRAPTSGAWVETVLSDFDAFLLDHAACERKASATAMTFVAHYPDRSKLVDAMISLAREELDHFHQVVRRVAKRGLVLAPDTPDSYVVGLKRCVRRGTEAYFLDRLLVAGIVEARGTERFGLLADALPEGEWKTFYRDLTRSELRHQAIFVQLAKTYFPLSDVEQRLEELLQAEAAIVQGLPLRSAVH